MKTSTKGMKKVQADAEVNFSPAIIGQFEGECADADMTNLNGMDINREVWEKVFSSDEYARGIELGHYIGFLGHPEDPACQDFEHACIVMKEGHMDDQGIVTGKFDLIGTPVGQLVKKFIDAGVKFGLSVRGVGDLIDNVVDPDTFIFRGFDLVAFPAYPNSIPTFTEIAASSDLNKQKMYKSICAAVDKNLDSLNTVQSVEVIQSCFAEQSDTYKTLEDRKKALKKDAIEEAEDITDDKIAGLTDLYLECAEELKKARAEVKASRKIISTLKNREIRKTKALERITAAQLTDMDEAMSNVAEGRTKAILANKKLKQRVAILSDQNLNYKRKIASNEAKLSENKTIIASLRHDLDETVNQSANMKQRSSNLDDTNRKLQARVQAAENMLAEYQSAYANLYAAAVGSRLDSISITASTTVDELQKSIARSSNIPQSSTVAPTPTDIVDIGMDDDLVTM